MKAHKRKRKGKKIAEDVTVTVSGTNAAGRTTEMSISDPDGDPLTVVELFDPFGVVASVSGTTLNILADQAGRFGVTYRVSDGDLTSSVAALSVRAAAAPTTSTTSTTSTTVAES